MIEITSSIQHSLGQDEAIRRMERLVENLTQSFPQQVHQVEWQARNNRLDVKFAAYGYVVSWRADIYDDQVSLEGVIPSSASKFRKKIGEAVASRVEAVLCSDAQAKAA